MKLKFAWVCVCMCQHGSKGLDAEMEEKTEEVEEEGSKR